MANPIPLARIARSAHLSGRDFRASQPAGAPLSGRHSMTELRRGLAVHTLDARTTEYFETRVTRAPGLVLHCFTAGEARASLGGVPMGLGRAPGAPVRVVLTALTEPAPFVRRAEPGDYMRKVNIKLSPEWMAGNGFDLAGAGQHALRARLAAPFTRLSWEADAETLAAFERLATLEDGDFPCLRLEREALTLGLVARAMARIGDAPPERDALLRPHERARLARMEACVAESSGPLPGLAEIAAEGGVSLSTMRRLFHAAHGTSVVSWARAERLDRARAALERETVTVSQAAALAGYGSPANFATAFRRQFGVAPSDIRRTRAG
ncbi:helix-turn-helix transcriptional regulator [Paroceanicella profunda]|uniref:helix-turn-helix transcriptional regulator n=1 Tax=Paroceanicella profunda TaxID=2579971 RepID=UPI001478CF35|nr:helix-turn-helix transcriptional regulator [Paroceanicella profunda]